MWSSLQIYTVEVQGKCSKVTVNCNSDAHGAVTECKKCIGTVNTVNSCIFGIINICSVTVVCTWMLSVALLSRYLRFGTTRDKWITIFCQGISYFPAASNWILAKKRPHWLFELKPFLLLCQNLKQQNKIYLQMWKEGVLIWKYFWLFIFLSKLRDERYPNGK